MEEQTDWQIVKEVDPDRFRVYVVIRYLSILGIVAHAGFIPLFFYLGAPFLAAFNVFSVWAWFRARALNEKGQREGAIAWITFEVVSHAVLATYALGWSSGFQLYLIPMIPFTIFNRKLTKTYLGFQTGALLFLYLWLYKTATESPAEIGESTLYVVYLSNSFIVFLALGLLSFYFRQASLSAETRLIEAATFDALTKLPNRRRMQQILQAEMEKSRHSPSSFLVALSDIDHFKSFNDTYGHECGDEVLRSVARCLRQTLRASDQVGRWGGEEFLLVLHAPSNLSEVFGAIERARSEVESHQLIYEGKTLQVTMTFGVALYQKGEPVADLLRRADELLYEGKSAGRNRVVFPLCLETQEQG